MTATAYTHWADNFLMSLEAQSPHVDIAPYFTPQKDEIDTDADIGVVNTSDIVFDNEVAAIQSTVIDVEFDHAAAAVIGDALNAAPSQNVVVGNVNGDVDTGGVFVEANDFAG